MDRRELLLCILAAGGGRAYEPAQIQKATFLVSTNLPNIVHRGPKFDFVPYNYGPFDRNVYVEAEQLRDAGRALIVPSCKGQWMTYAASGAGVEEGNASLQRLRKKTNSYIQSVSEWVLAQSFGSLVKAIYDEYPEMRQNSIFQG